MARSPRYHDQVDSASARAPTAVSPPLERARERLRVRRALASGVEHFGRAALLSSAVAGTLVLTSRSFEPHATAPWVPFALALGVSALSAGFSAWRARPTDAQAAAWLDVNGGASGEVLTEAELGSSVWSPRAAERIELALARLPRAPWRRALARTCAGGAFLLAALWIPTPRIDGGPGPTVTQHALERVEEQLAVLTESLELEPELEQELRERLERVSESAENERFDSAFEALDRLEDRLADEAARALDAAESASSQLALAASDPHLDHAQEALEAALAKLDEGGFEQSNVAATKAALGADVESLPSGLQLDSAQLAKLSRQLDAKTLERLGKLASARLIDAKRLSELLDARPGEAGELDPDHVCDENCKKPGGT